MPLLVFSPTTNRYASLLQKKLLVKRRQMTNNGKKPNDLDSEMKTPNSGTRCCFSNPHHSLHGIYQGHF